MKEVIGLQNGEIAILSVIFGHSNALQFVCGLVIHTDAESVTLEDAAIAKPRMKRDRHGFVRAVHFFDDSIPIADVVKFQRSHIRRIAVKRDNKWVEVMT